jgi:hypothetical protein
MRPSRNGDLADADTKKPDRGREPASATRARTGDLVDGAREAGALVPALGTKRCPSLPPDSLEETVTPPTPRALRCGGGASPLVYSTFERGPSSNRTLVLGQHPYFALERTGPPRGTPRRARCRARSSCSGAPVHHPTRDEMLRPANGLRACGSAVRGRLPRRRGSACASSWHFAPAPARRPPPAEPVRRPEFGLFAPCVRRRPLPTLASAWRPAMTQQGGSACRSSQSRGPEGGAGRQRAVGRRRSDGCEA